MIQPYEQALIEHLIAGLQEIAGVRIYGITERAKWQQRVATVALRKEGITPQQLAKALAEQNVFVTEGNYYAIAISERLGVEQSGGMLRVGLTHYNTTEEIDYFLRVLARTASS